MAKGKKEFKTPQKDKHMDNFEAALKDALEDWDPYKGDKTESKVTFEISVSPNPGGIKEYRIKLT
jgi:hypothetical protein